MILLFIFVINIAYVTISTVRLILMMKGYRTVASAVSFAEVFVYISGLSVVLDHMDSILNVIVYCLGFAIGVYTGSLVEEKLAMGYVTVQVITRQETSDMPNQLRDAGFGVTSWYGEGLTGQRLVLSVLTKRNRQKELVEHVHGIDPHAFIVSMEPKTFVGGFWVRRTQ
ncbi:DUF2179 domain-containing protein [Mechercharimyces sp. CAU 1602]|uniref:DUF2179 domain-containing protein n=1 Tax=Mechercharimyces sp. CAU 1602 TaxID=2973933 RepID=UPI0021634F53|nr:DUF2179 domain-containing protein [Mechercharimyces sp. CAU 1602]